MYLNSIITKLQVERNGIKLTSLQPETKILSSMKREELQIFVF